MTSTPLFSVVVCTYNRAALLPNCLASLATQNMNDDDYEIVIVDNNSTDATADVARKLQKKISNLRYEFEPRQGLSNARNCGWRTAIGEYVVYVDDECRMPAGWLDAALELVERHSPCCFGGPYVADFDGERPTWFKDYYYGTLDYLGGEERVLGSGSYLSGGNLFVRKTLLERYGGFNPELGMNGRNLGFGEEIALQEKIRSVEPDALVYYSPKLVVRHLVLPDKVVLNRMIARAFANGRGSWKSSEQRARSKRHGLVRLPWRAGLFVWLVVSVPIGMLVALAVRDRSRYPNYKNFVFEVCLPKIVRGGALIEELRRTFPR